MGGLDGPPSLKLPRAAPVGDLLRYGVPPRWSTVLTGMVLSAWKDGECWIITVCPHSRAPAVFWGAGVLGGIRRLSCITGNEDLRPRLFCGPADQLPHPGASCGDF